MGPGWGREDKPAAITLESEDRSQCPPIRPVCLPAPSCRGSAVVLNSHIPVSVFPQEAWIPPRKRGKGTVGEAHTGGTVCRTAISGEMPSMCVTALASE